MFYQCSFNFLQDKGKGIERILTSWDCLEILLRKYWWDFVDKWLTRRWGNIELENRLRVCWENIDRMLSFTQCSLLSPQVKEHCTFLDYMRVKSINIISTFRQPQQYINSSSTCYLVLVLVTCEFKVSIFHQHQQYMHSKDIFWCWQSVDIWLTQQGY